MQSVGYPAQRGFAILSDGKLMYWGKGVSGQHGVPAEHPDLDWPTEKVKSVACGNADSVFMVLEDGRIRVSGAHPYDNGDVGTAPYVSNGNNGEVLTDVVQVKNQLPILYTHCNPMGLFGLGDSVTEV